MTNFNFPTVDFAANDGLYFPAVNQNVEGADLIKFPGGHHDFISAARRAIALCEALRGAGEAQAMPVIYFKGGKRPAGFPASGISLTAKDVKDFNHRYAPAPATGDAELAAAFRAYCVGNNLTVAEAAEALGVPKKTLDHISQGNGFRYPKLLLKVMGMV